MQTIYLDISNKGVIPCITAKQSEVGRKFLAVITDNGVPYNIPADSLLSVWYEGDTDAGNYSSIKEKSAFSIDGNKVTVELVAQMLFRPGNGELCLSITHGDGGETNTWNIPYYVEYKPGAGSPVPTEYYTAFQEMASLVAKYAEEAKKASESMEVLAPVGYTFQWSPVSGSNIDLSTAEKVHNHFGFGTWEQVKDRFLLAAGESYEAGATGGEAEHLLSTEQIPQLGVNVFREADTGSGKWAYVADFTQYKEGSAYAGTFSIEQKPVSIMPPYFAVYTWKRIA